MRAVETASIAVFIVLLGFSLQRIEAPSWSLPLTAIGGWLLADLFSGLVHWALDRFGNVRTPVIGPAIIRPFREHHADPQGMTRHGFIEVNGASCLGCLPVLLMAVCFDLNPFLHSVLCFFSLGILLANQCHKWAHAEQAGILVRRLQAMRLILSPIEHAKHHTPPYCSHYCTASGWLNRPLDALLK